MSLHYLSFNPAQNWLTSQLSNKTTYAVMAGLAAIVATLLSKWQMSDESWGYWFFARILGETGEFIIPDRSPIYTLYLNAFRWLGYPASMDGIHLNSKTYLGRVSGENDACYNPSRIPR